MSYILKSILAGLYLWIPIYLMIKFAFPLLKEDSSTSSTIKFFSILCWSISGFLFFYFWELYLGLTFGVVVIKMTASLIGIYDINKINKLTAEDLIKDKTKNKIEIWSSKTCAFLIKDNEQYNYTRNEILENVSKIDGLKDLKQISSEVFTNGSYILEKISFNCNLLEKCNVENKIETIIRYHKNTLYIEKWETY